VRKKAEALTLVRCPQDKTVHLGTMRAAAHQMVDEIANSIARNGYSLRGISVVEVYRDNRGNNRFSADLVCMNDLEISTAMSAFAFKINMDSWKEVD
jgi:hypothetical protein